MRPLHEVLRPPALSIRDDATALVQREPRFLQPIPPALAAENIRPTAELMAELTRDIEAGSFRLRSPATSLADLCPWPFLPVGYCLPGFPEGRSWLWVDPTVPAQHGDFVLVKFTDRALQWIVQSSFHDPKWASTYLVNNQLSNTAIKWLLSVGGRYQLTTLETNFPIESAQILGVVRFVTVDGRPVYGCSCNPVWRVFLWLAFHTRQFLRRRIWGRY